MTKEELGRGIGCFFEIVLLLITVLIGLLLILTLSS